jgi:hypothetical protein
MTVSRGTTRTTTLRGCTVVPDPVCGCNAMSHWASAKGREKPAARSDRRLPRTWGRIADPNALPSVGASAPSSGAGDPRGTRRHFSEAKRPHQRTDNPRPFEAVA